MVHAGTAEVTPCGTKPTSDTMQIAENVLLIKGGTYLELVGVNSRFIAGMIRSTYSARIS